MRVHMTGICGTGMAALAVLLKAAGNQVSGSDAAPYPPMSTFLDSLGIPYYKGYDPDRMEAGKPELVIMGNIARKDNPEALRALELHLALESLPSALHLLFLKNRVPLVVTGTHGKTTTSSMLAWLLHSGGLEPSYFVGGIPLNFGQNSGLGKGRHFVVEGDEYDSAFFDKRPKFLHYRAATAILTSVEFDHADIYADLDAVKAAFRSFVGMIGPKGLLMVSTHFPHALQVAATATCRVQTYGVDTDADWRAEGLEWRDGGCRFSLTGSLGGRAVRLEGLFLPMTGLHNVQNAVAASAVALELGVSEQRLREGLASFKGVAKRQQLLARVRGISVFDDFAHHPTAVTVTLEGLRLAHAPRRLVAAFHFESNTSRRRIFEQEYIEALAGADLVFLSMPLKKKDSLDESMYLDPRRIQSALAERGVPCQVEGDIERMAAAIASELVPGDLFVGMSGRDFEGLHLKVIRQLG